MKLIKLEILIIILVHVACCNFLKIGLVNEQRGLASWIIKNGFKANSMWELYFISLYFIIITICTIGYGDIYPYQLNEKLFIAFLSILATNITAYTFSQISEIVKFESTKNQKFNDFMTNINHQMKTLGLGMSLSVKVRKHFEFAYYQDEQKKQISDSIVDKLPNNLKNEVLLDVYQEQINSIKMFKEFSSDCLKNILLSFKQKQLFPDEILVNQNENSENLYFLISGSLEINFLIRETKYGKVYEKSNQKIQKSDVFGYEGFLISKCSPYQLKSIGLSLVSYIDKNSFLQILKQYPEDQEKFFCLRDSAIFGQKSLSLKFSECISCGKFSHLIQNCPYLSLSLAYKPCKQNNTRNQQFLRKRERYRNTLKNMVQLQEQAIAVQVNNDESLIVDAYNIFLDMLKISEEKQTDDTQSDYSQSFVNNSKTNYKVQSFIFQSNQAIPQQTTEQQENQNVSLQSLNQTKPISFNSQSLEQSQIAKTKSQKLGKNNKLDNSEFELNQNRLEHKQVNESNSDYYQKSKETDQQNEDSENKNTNKSIMITQDVLKDFNDLNQNSEKSKNFHKLVSIDENFSPRHSSNLSKVLNINTFEIQQYQNHFSEADINFINEAFQRRKLKIHQHTNAFQKPLTEEATRKKSSNFGKKKQSVILLDILMNLGDKKLKLIQDKINNTQNKEYLNNLIQLVLNISKSRSDNQLLSTYFHEGQHIIYENSKQADGQNQQIENCTEFQIRQKIGLQDLDMLVVRKQFMLQQQQNKIQNFIQVPDNEMDIDMLQNFKYYNVNYNYKFVLNRYNNYQDKKMVLQLNKLKQLISPKKFKKQKIKESNINNEKNNS
ncbi:cyclic nucleotide-binding domain protein, putative (macronuclear) [Tetrahymena thermophila SB210]|uniref:Cyclic nucleotide-binding domain protein, putative n=1 Tax=Tetrahymena thermophila (strain SB210) TaxID=312017 RepID=Q22U36_TETTS|nr:cyclic nucleotide-binding domain protein, putative [Tetrahymena thermophila SB210]EAR88851.2 cyclic nucleotide-binding domain protein, putative [Tetrahymena thermophila SB210]|eukprot:XP_001009096.2 cyclic nucleotide-binding domain protein, putative [Tetrahymena thermophila SB210]